MKLIIVGGVAGGASAAARARRLSEETEIIIFERGSEPSFANCGLPYYIGAEIADRKKLLVAPKKLLEQRYNLDVRTHTEVLSINRQAKTVRARNLQTREKYEESYDKLILSPGAAPVRLPIPGADMPTIHTLRNLDDTDRLRSLVDDGIKSAVVIGAGFIGLEVAENLVRRGITTSVIERDQQVLPPWDKEITTPLSAHLHEKGIKLYLGDTAKAFEEKDGKTIIRLQSGTSLDAELVLLSVGVRPENKLAREAGLEIGPRGGIVVNEHMQTTNPDIYAVGDAVQVRDFVTGNPTQIPLAGPANRQGRIAADHIFGRDTAYRGTQGTAIVRIFDLTAALTGLSEKAALRDNITYRKVYVHPANHAGYFPGAQPLTLKVLFAPDTGQILGAQAVGAAGVDKRIDVLATAIGAGMTVYDLEEIELAYAPPYGSAKDPINMAGFVAAGSLRGDQPLTYAEQLNEAIDNIILDVRTPAEFQQGHIPGALNIPIDDLRNHLDELPVDKPITTYCKVGFRGYLATRILRQHGYDASNLAGGYTTWRTVYPEEQALLTGV